jgi:hypothetical protein
MSASPRTGTGISQIARSRHYENLKIIGHTRPTASFAAPALIWHVALWPERAYDPNNVDLGPLSSELLKDLPMPDGAPQRRWGRRSKPVKQDHWGEKVQDELHFARQFRAELEACKPQHWRPATQRAANAHSHHRHAIEAFLDRTYSLDTQVNQFLYKLQELGRLESDRAVFLRRDFNEADAPVIPSYAESSRRSLYHDGIASSRGKPSPSFGLVSPESIIFTLWWTDNGPIRGAKPGPDALRVIVTADMHSDFWSITFAIDAASTWRAKTGQTPAGNRRQTIFDHIAAIEASAAQQIEQKRIEAPLLPEQVDAATATALEVAARYLYETIWTEFRRDFQLDSAPDAADLTALTGGHQRVFANFCGLVHATAGLGDSPDGSEGSRGQQAFPRFANNDGTDTETPNEANAVVKAHWPFLRRVIPELDRREPVACGLMDWRVLYLTTLGSKPLGSAQGGSNSSSFSDEAESRAVNIEHNHLLEDDPDYDPSNPLPVRYLFLTKGKPHPRQIGRTIERVNALGTMRIYALKDWNTLRDASIHIRMRGQELDRIIREWSIGRDYIEQNTPSQRDLRDNWIGHFTQRIERRLLTIGGALDEIGTHSIGGIHYRINRSRYYVKEFRILLDTLHVGNIGTWISYRNFYERGLHPAFDFIDNLGGRLDSLRRRLLSVTESIQTSALVAQASATRENTMELRRISKAAQALGIAGSIASLLSATKTTLELTRLTVAGASASYVDLILAILVFLVSITIIGIVWPREG